MKMENKSQISPNKSRNSPNFWSYFPFIINGYIFWTVFSALPAMIWFYPLNELELSGYEIFVLCLFSPLILRINFVYRFFQTKPVDLMLQFLILCSLLSFQAHDTFWRLCFLSIGAFCAMLKFSLDFSSGKKSIKDDDLADCQKLSIFYGYTGGYVAFLATRIPYKTMIPAFNDYRSNFGVFFIGLINFIVQCIFALTDAPKKDQVPKKQGQVKPGQPHWLTGIGFGSLIYIILGIFGELSVPFRWIVLPYPNPGPNSNPWALLIFACLILGFWLGAQKSETCDLQIFHPLWSLTGFSSFFGLYKFDGFPGLIFACILAIYVGTMWTLYANSFWQCANPAIPFTLAMIFYLVPAFYSVWTVAFNFVPLGYYTREFTGLLICWVMFFVSLNLHIQRRHIDQYREVNKRLKNDESSKFWTNFCAFLFILASASMAHRYNQWKPGEGRFGHVTDRSAATGGQNHVAIVTPMIWTYHFGYDNQGWPSLERTVKLINDIGADIVGLLETDASKLHMGNNDLATWLAETLNMYVDYGPATKKHTWGCMLLSKYPILASEHHLMPSPKGELAPAISALLDVHGSKLAVVVYHMGNDGDDLDRKLQASYLANLTSNFVNQGYPVVFLGYVTSYSHSRDYKVFTNEGRLKDIDPGDRDRFCEYIFYQNLVRLSYARISHASLSDTEIQTAKFAIPTISPESRDPKMTFRDNDDVIIEPDAGEIPKEHLYNPIFGQFFRGHYSGHDHRFHMSTPKYFVSRDRK